MVEHRYLQEARAFLSLADAAGMSDVAAVAGTCVGHLRALQSVIDAVELCAAERERLILELAGEVGQLTRELEEVRSVLDRQIEGREAGGTGVEAVVPARVV